MSMPILKKNRMNTGISDLDIILEGGYRNPGNIILVGPSGSEKAALAYHFAAAAGPNENVVMICGNASPHDIIEKAEALGIRLGNVSFIDCYTQTLGKEVVETDKIKSVPGPSALNDLSLALNETIKTSTGKKIRIVFDTLSTFVLYNPQDSIRKFLSVIEGRLKSANATTLFLVDDGVHDKQILGVLEHGMDDKITVVDKGSKYSIMIPDLEIEIPIRIGPSGLVVA